MMTEKEQIENPGTDEQIECGACTTATDLTLTDVLAPSIDIKSVTDDATIEERYGSTTRGQHVKKCPTDPLPLHVNITGAVVNVSGDLKVDPNSCPVRISFAPGAGAIFQPGLNIGITVPVAAGFLMNGRCDKSKKAKLCKWSFTRTSP